MHDQYTVPPKVIYEEISGEVVVINLDTGSYYSIGDSGFDIWVKLIRSASTSQIANNLANNYGDKFDKIQKQIESFVAELVEEGLVILKTEIEKDASKAYRDRVPENGYPTSTGKQGEFRKPILEKYSDMEDLLLLDPIHDVEEAGWPAKLENQSSSENS